jgi:hypothetical protein
MFSNTFDIRKKLYLRMSNVLLLNNSILAIYVLWKSSEIVLLTNRSQWVMPHKDKNNNNLPPLDNFLGKKFFRTSTL